MITFNPGPSYLSDRTKEILHEIIDSNFLSQSHRSPAFSAAYQLADQNIRKALELPEEFTILFQPSATATMECILRNLVINKSYHFVHGAFSKRFFQTAIEIGLDPTQFESPWEEAVDWRKSHIPEDNELITITHNETSSGLIWPIEEMEEIRKTFTKQLIAIDVTSSLGAIRLPWEVGDIWFSSVQKCLGLPAGLSLLFINEKTLAKAEEVHKEKKEIPSWQSLIKMQKKATKFQTFETPNMLLIALIGRVLEEWNIDRIEKETYEKAELLYKSSQRSNNWNPYISDPQWRSPTSLNFEVNKANEQHEKAKEKGYTLGKGYGPLKERCIRIANFPAIQKKMIEELIKQFF